jgi:hypothetical protein
MEKTPPGSPTTKNNTPLTPIRPKKTPKVSTSRNLFDNFNTTSSSTEPWTVKKLLDDLNKINNPDIIQIVRLLDASQRGTLGLGILKFVKRVQEFDDFISKYMRSKMDTYTEQLIRRIIFNLGDDKTGFIIKRLNKLSISPNEHIDSAIKKAKQIKELHLYKTVIDNLNIDMFKQIFKHKTDLLITQIKTYILTDLSRITKLKNNIPNSLKINPSELNRKKSEILDKYSSSRIERGDIRKLLLEKNKDLNTLRAFDFFSTADIKTFKQQILKQLGFSIERIYRDILSDHKRKLKYGNINDLTREIYSYQKNDINVSDILRILRNFKPTINKNTNTYKNKNKLFNAYLERFKLNNNITISNSNKKFLSNRPDLLFRLDTEKKKYAKGKRERVFKTYNIIKKEQLDEYKKSGKEKPMSYFKNRYGFTNAQLKEIKSKNYLNNIKNEYVNTNRKYYKQFISIRMKYWDDLKKHLIKKNSGNKNYSKTIRDITTEYKNNVDKLNEGYGRTYASKMKMKIMKHIRPREKQIQQKLKRVADKLKKM